jgi:hypothetical protein
LKYTLPMFQITLSTNNQPVSLYVGDIPMLAGNKTANLTGDDTEDFTSIDRLPAGTDGPYIPSTIKLFNYSGIQVQDPSQIGGEELGWTALVFGVRGFPPQKPITEISPTSSPEPKSSKESKEIKENKESKKTSEDVIKKFMAKNQSLIFEPTVCVVRCTGQRTDSRNVDFDCEFKNWIDADYWLAKSGKEFIYFYLIIYITS